MSYYIVFYLKLFFIISQVDKEGNKIIKSLTLSKTQLSKLKNLIPEMESALKDKKEEKKIELPGSIFVECSHHSKFGDYVIQIRQWCKYLIKLFNSNCKWFISRNLSSMKQTKGIQ